MVKILSQAGMSLADTYDVKGSVAGIDQLETRELSIVHEMGATVFSERFRMSIRRVASGDKAQSLDFTNTLDDLPPVPTRILGVVVVSDDASRIAQASISVRNAVTVQELPIWVYDGSTFLPIRIDDDGVRGNFDLLVGSLPATMLPTFIGGSGQLEMPSEIIMAGRTTAFGAGTVFLRAFYYVAFAELEGISSRGLPIPSW